MNEEIEVQYDDQLTDVVDKVNVALKSYHLQFTYDDEKSREGIVVYKIEYTE